MDTDGSLKAADLLVSGEMEMFFQPIVELESEKVYGYEALLRGRGGYHVTDREELFGRRGCLGKEEFVKTDMACLGSALRGGSKLAGEHFLFLKVHACTLLELSKNKDVFTGLLGALDISPDRLVLEVSERTDYSCIAMLGEVVPGFLKMGLRMAVEDIGTSLRWFHHMLCVKPMFLKLHRSFVTELETNGKRKAVTRSIDVMTKKVGMSVIAEGVEDARVIEALNFRALTYGQGFLYGKPEPAGRWLPGGEEKGGVMR